MRVAAGMALALALAAAVSCGKKPETGTPGSRMAAVEAEDSARSNRGSLPPSDTGPMSIRIHPEIVGAGTRLHLTAAGFDLRDGQIEWRVNGDLAPGRPEDSFPTDALRKETTVQARVKFGEQDLFSNTVTLVNSPPEILSVRLVPEGIRPGDSIGVEAEGTDRDGDPVTFEYRWEKNGQPAGTGSRLEGALRRDDAIAVRITPFDGEVRGNFLVVRREVKNYPPAIRGVSDALLAEGVYTCRVSADDGDDDPLSFALTKSPEGMTVDPATGAIRWTVPDGFAGAVPVAVTVSDGHGGEAVYPFTLTIREEASKKSPPPAGKPAAQ